MKLKILGIAQDGGVPQINCHCSNCIKARQNSIFLYATSFLIKLCPTENILIDASPDLKYQINPKEFKHLKAIILTHAHVGHFLGLAQLSYEISNKKNIVVFVSKKMHKFLLSNEPWKSLVNNKNIKLRIFTHNKKIFYKGVNIKPIKVPHRNELSDTYGLIIKNKLTITIIPDISQWNQWNLELSSIIKKTNLAFLDGTFFHSKELPNRDLKSIGHPLIVDTIKELKELPLKHQNKVHFIHFNHTNPVLNNLCKQTEIKKNGLNLAKQFSVFDF
jgi:pyrroloquinoline quinone biosynthesis protein B